MGPDGATDLVAETGGGPNGAAVGPDGKLYVCNNGKAFDYVDMGGMMLPVQPPSNFEGGRIERVDIDSGEVDVLYTECEGSRRCAPPMTSSSMRTADSGSPTTACARSARTTAPAWFYAKPDGSEIGRSCIRSIPNGLGLSPDARASTSPETYTACAGGGRSPHPAWWSLHPACCSTQAVVALLGFQFLDSLGVDGDGNVCLATLGSGGITSVSPDDGSVVDFVETGDISSA